MPAYLGPRLGLVLALVAAAAGCLVLALRLAPGSGSAPHDLAGAESSSAPRRPVLADEDDALVTPVRLVADPAASTPRDPAEVFRGPLGLQQTSHLESLARRMTRLRERYRNPELDAMSRDISAQGAMLCAIEVLASATRGPDREYPADDAPDGAGRRGLSMRPAAGEEREGRISMLSVTGLFFVDRGEYPAFDELRERRERLIADPPWLRNEPYPEVPSEILAGVDTTVQEALALTNSVLAAPSH